MKRNKAKLAACVGMKVIKDFHFSQGSPGRTIPILGRGTLATEMEKQPEKGTQIYSGFKRRPFIKCE